MQFDRALVNVDYCKSSMFLVKGLVENADMIYWFGISSFSIFFPTRMQSATRALERTTKESSRGLGPISPVLPGETTTAGWPAVFLQLSDLITLPNSAMMYKTDMRHYVKLQTSTSA